MTRGALAVIGGTGLNQLSDSGAGLAGLKAGEISPGLATPYGEASAIPQQWLGASGPLWFLARHGQPHRLPPHRINYRANIWLLKELGVTEIVAVNAVGGINPRASTGSMLCPDQLIDYSYGREHTFSDGESGSELQHIDFTEPFDAALSRRLIAAAGRCGLPCGDGGVYACVQGPRLESAAEVNRLERDGCDVVGMTAMPEAGLARELGMRYASLCLVVNPAAGRSEAPITLQAIEQVVASGMQDVRTILGALITGSAES